MARVHYPLTFPSWWSTTGSTWRPACDARSGDITEDVSEVTCRPCLRSRYGPNADEMERRFERQRAAAAARAKDRREAEKVVLARHAGELEQELALRALARLGS